MAIFQPTITTNFLSMSSIIDDSYAFMCLRDELKISGPGVPTLCVKPTHGLYPVELRPVPAPDPKE
jgi:hypothetical protein